ncbi:hypothetical protein RSAG8_11592, partial [Rhizoctonia solani AG-8 WAC10335]
MFNPAHSAAPHLSRPVQEEWVYDSDDSDVVLTGVNIPGVYTAKFVTEEHDAGSTISHGRSGNGRPCLVTEDDTATTVRHVLKLNPSDPIAAQLASTWGFGSGADLCLHLDEMRDDMAAAFAPESPTLFALVPEMATLDRIREAVQTESLTPQRHYLDELPNEIRQYQYIHLRGKAMVLSRKKNSTEVNDADEPREIEEHKFPYPSLTIQGTFHPYFMIVDTAQKVSQCQGSAESDIPCLLAQQQRCLQLCVDIYHQWLHQGVGKVTEAWY